MSNNVNLAVLVNDLEPIEPSLDSMYLDPNNPRFAAANHVHVPDAEISDGPVQSETRRRLIASFGVERLRGNMEVNGYLPIDRVVVRQFAQDKYVVLEGNRRICAAKMLAENLNNGLEVPEEVATSIEQIPCLEYVGKDSDAAWIFQGLRHITGITDWPAYNKARLLVEQMEQEDLNLTQVGKRFGLTAFGAGQWVRGYYAYLQASEGSDYVREVDERAYPYFQELFSRSSIDVREWMEWSERDKRFQNELNFNEYLSWLYPRREDRDGDDELGDWDRRALATRDEIRSVAYLIKNDPQAFRQFRDDLNVELAYSTAVSKRFEQEARDRADASREVFDSIERCTKALQSTPFTMLKDEGRRSELFSALKGLEEAIFALKS